MEIAPLMSRWLSGLSNCLVWCLTLVLWKFNEMGDDSSVKLIVLARYNERSPANFDFPILCYNAWLLIGLFWLLFWCLLAYRLILVMFSISYCEVSSLSSWIYSCRLINSCFIRAFLAHNEECSSTCCSCISRSHMQHIIVWALSLHIKSEYINVLYLLPSMASHYLTFIIGILLSLLIRILVLYLSHGSPYETRLGNTFLTICLLPIHCFRSVENEECRKVSASMIVLGSYVVIVMSSSESLGYTVYIIKIFNGSGVPNIRYAARWQTRVQIRGRIQWCLCSWLPFNCWKT